MKTLKSYNSIFKVSLFFSISILQFNFLLAQSDIPDSLVKERLQFIKQKLDQNKTNANLWWYGWLAGYSAATLGQGLVYFISNNKSTRQDMALGAATTLLGAVGQIITPMVPGYAPNHLALLNENNSDQRLIKLSVAEELLKSCSDREIEGRSWQVHTLCGLVNLGGGLITWLGFKRTIWSGVGYFALNTLVTEAQIWSQPIRSIKDYQNYCKKYKNGTTSFYLKYNLKCYVNVYPKSIILKLSF